GVYTYSLGELFGLRQPCMADAGPLFVSAIEELGAGVPSPVEAARILVYHCLCAVIEGAGSQAALRGLVSELGRTVYGKQGDLILAACGNRDVIGWYATLDYVPHEVEAGYLGPGEADHILAETDREVLSFARSWLREHCATPFDPAWQTAIVTALAQAIYDERAFDRLPILADA